MPAVPPVAGHDEHARDFYGADPGKEKDKDKGKDKDKKDKKDKHKDSDTGKLVAAGVGGAALGALAYSAFSDDGINSPMPLPRKQNSICGKLTIAQITRAPRRTPHHPQHPRLLVMVMGDTVHQLP